MTTPTDVLIEAARKHAPGRLTRDDALKFMAELLLVLVADAMPVTPTAEAEGRLIRIGLGDFDDE